MPTPRDYDPACVVSVLAWLDTMERLDTLIIEIRHVQCNILHFLRSPDLYRPLQFENAYLWGECRDGCSWFTVFPDLREPQEQLKELARAWVIRYPPRAGKPKRTFSDVAKKYTEYKDHESIIQTMYQAIRNATRLGIWNVDSRRHYFNLCTLQTLKSNIVRDKLVLCLWGYRTFNSYIYRGGGQQVRDTFYDYVAQFMIVRSAIAARIRNYVERLGDLQAQLERSLDLSLQDDPPPIKGRRQEQGFYTSYLSVRCRELQESLDSVLHFVGAPPSGRSLIMHRWVHDFTSAARQLIDEVYTPHDDDHDHLCGTAQCINSSYWMPDRPDLLGMLAHELAHSELHARYNKLLSPFLDLNDDSFARLAKLLYACFAAYRIPSDISEIGDNNVPSPPSRPNYAILEITSDLLAASVEGPSFLYAAFLELTAAGIGDLLEAPVERLDLDLAFNMDESLDPAILDYSWYFRLQLLCSWLGAIHHRESGPIVETLIEGIQKLTDTILNYLAGMSRHQEITALWRNLKYDLCEIATHSQAATQVRKWRKRRSKEAAPNKAFSNVPPAYASPPFMRRLNTSLRGFLFCMLLDRKRKRLLPHDETKVRDLAERFVKVYLAEFPFRTSFLTAERDGSSVIHDDTPLFLHLYDVPWECAILRGIDFVHKKSKVSDWLHAFHFDVALGREVYQIAMEFYLWQTRSPADRLSTAIRVVAQGIKADSRRDGITDDERGVIQTWLRMPSREIQDRLPALSIEQLTPDDIQSCVDFLYTDIRSYLKSSSAAGISLRDIAKRYPAEVLRAASQSSFPDQAIVDAERHHQARVLEKLQGYKLAELLKILNKILYSGNHGEPGNAQWLELRYYLTLRQSKTSKSRPDDEDSETTVALLLKAVNLSIQPNDVYSTSLYQIGRFAVSNPAVASGEEQTSHLLMANAGWIMPAANGRSAVLYQTTLGRFDFVTLENAPPMFRARLPAFSCETDKFLPFICRSEQVLPCRLNLDASWPLYDVIVDPDNPPPIIAFLSILLTQRSARLSFLSRLIKEGGHGLSGSAHTLGWAATLLREKRAVAFLSEGWGDIVIAILDNKDNETAKKTSQLVDIFDIQDAIYHDFLVERTELILTPMCLRAAAHAPALFDIVVNFRIRADREMRFANRRFEQAIVTALNGKIVNFSKVPGTTDYILRAKWENMFDGDQKYLGDLLKDAMSEVEDIVTVISRNVYTTAS